MKRIGNLDEVVANLDEEGSMARNAKSHRIACFSTSSRRSPTSARVL
jgi:hypothetical protein